MSWVAVSLAFAGIVAFAYFGWRLWKYFAESGRQYQEELDEFEFQERLARERKEGLR
jgi:hypothetical protein